MSSYGLGRDFDPTTYVSVSTSSNVPPNEDPDRTFVGLLRRELMTATEREKETNMALATLTVEADAVTRERIAIERAIKAYEQDPRNKRGRDIDGEQVT